MRVLVSVAAVLMCAACGGGGGGGESGDPPGAAAPPVVPVKEVVRKMDNFVGTVSLQASIPPATTLFLTVRSADQGTVTFRGQNGRRIEVSTEVRGVVLNAPGLPTQLNIIYGFYSVTDGRYLGQVTSGGVQTAATSTAALPDTAAIGASGPLGTAETYDATRTTVVVSRTVSTWSLTSSTTPGRAWLCIRQVTTSAATLVSGAPTDVCAESNAAGELLKWRGSQTVPGVGAVTFQ